MNYSLNRTLNGSKEIDSANDDLAIHRVEDAELLLEDPLHSTLPDSTSFKRKHKASLGFSLPRLLSPVHSNTDRAAYASYSIRNPSTRIDRDRSSDDTRATPETNLSYPYTSADGGSEIQDNKDGGTLDWQAEGPGRRVGYDDLTAIDWIFEYAKERQRLRVLYSTATGLVGYMRQVADASQIWWVLIATGIASGVIAGGIDVASDWLGDLKTGYCKTGAAGGKFYLNKSFCCWGHDEYAQCQDWNPWGAALGIASKGGSWIIEYIFFVVFSILFAACASVLVKNYSIHAKQSGIPEIKTMLGGFVIQRFMGTWTLVIKSLGLCLAVASGLWLGKEGPLVHVACCCASLFMKIFDNLNYNEAFNPFRTGKLVLYQVTYHTGWHGFEFIPFAILGMLGGLYGGLFIKLNMRIASFRRNSSLAVFKSPVLEVILATFVTALINFPIRFMRAQSSELVYTLFAECADITEDNLGLCKSGIANTGVILLLVVSAVLGFFLAAMTFGLQMPAGILLPSMAIGALYGRAVGLIVEVWQREHPSWFVFAGCKPDVPCVTPGTYAIIGAASALGGVTRMTVSIVVIMFELTGALTYVLPIMIAVMISKWVGDAITKRGIYESWIHFNTYPFLDNRDDSPIPDVPVSQIMTRLEDLVVITATGHTIEALQKLLRTHPHRGFPVVNDRGEAILLGYISRTELAFALRTAVLAPLSLPPDTDAYFKQPPHADPTMTTLDLRPWMDQTPITLNSRSSLQLTATMFQRLGLRYVLFTDFGILAGLLTKKDVWFVLNAGDGRSVDESAGVLREDGRGEERGLLRIDGDDERDGIGEDRRGGEG
ncbi:hypothetical protein LTR04_005735 [Oleoguttula sp. CCFEE 6159]|nr:hypothetical protein LTR04_005735 [Oleoguttula sp. CCFEE 6159]